MDNFSKLSWSDLDAWAGSTIVSRGREYHRHGAVKDLVLTLDGGLLAWVKGSSRYTVKVFFGSDGQLTSICSCPYENTCKHAVAVILQYLSMIENDLPVPAVIKHDQRLKLFEQFSLDDETNEIMNEHKDIEKSDLTTILKKKTKEQLIELINVFAQDHPDITDTILSSQRIESGNIKPVINKLRRAIQELNYGQDWRDYYDHDDYIPDLSKFIKQFSSLLKGGYADEVLELGKEFIFNSNKLIETIDDEGETGFEITDCISVIAQALDKSSLEPVDRITYALDIIFEDNYDLCEPFAEYLNTQFPKDAWNTIADRLFTKLKKIKEHKKKSDYPTDYNRRQISNWIIHALERAGRDEEIIPLCETEAIDTGEYSRLVSRLIELKMYTKAEEWIKTGIRNLGKKLPGIVTELRRKYQDIHKIKENWDIVAAIEVEEFVQMPSLFGYRDCKKICEKIGNWPQVRKCLLNYVETGEIPCTTEHWPLPETGLDIPLIDRKYRYMEHDLPIQIAVEDKDPERVIYWVDKIKKSGISLHQNSLDMAAEAIKNFNPDRAVALWQNITEDLINEVKPRSYEYAINYLKKAYKVMQSLNKQDQWHQYISDLRTKHRAKRKLIEFLDRFNQKPIIKSSQ